MTQHTLKVSIAFSSVKPFGPFSQSQIPCFVFHRNLDYHDVMKDYQSRLSCEVNRRCLACGQFIHQDVFYIMMTTYVYM